jgi:hypothetical protein
MSPSQSQEPPPAALDIIQIELCFIQHKRDEEKKEEQEASSVPHGLT